MGFEVSKLEVSVYSKSNESKILQGFIIFSSLISHEFGYMCMLLSRYKEHV